MEDSMEYIDIGKQKYNLLIRSVMTYRQSEHSNCLGAKKNNLYIILSDKSIEHIYDFLERGFGNFSIPQRTIYVEDVNGNLNKKTEPVSSPISFMGCRVYKGENNDRMGIIGCFCCGDSTPFSLSDILGETDERLSTTA